MEEGSSKRRRLRDLGITIGDFQTGPLNAITDVEGVAVGHKTLIEGAPEDVATGVVRTGVTAILPQQGDLFMNRVAGGAFVLNGAGELSGLIQVLEWGLIETPILLTNTLSVGIVAQGAIQYLLERFPDISNEHDVLIPLVGECDDSFLNDIAGPHVHIEHVYEALDDASGGPVEEGGVGAGTGMVSFDLKGGIGTSSRCVPGGGDTYTLGVLVLNNFGRIRDLRVDGVPVGRELEPWLEGLAKRVSLHGSIISVLATDAPLSTHQLTRLSKRVALGLGRTGSYAAHGSGEIILAFSTANRVPRSSEPRLLHFTQLSNQWMDPLYQAAIECTEEAVLNSLCMAEEMVGVDHHLVRALPSRRLVEIFEKYRGETRS
jgi:D-aminopeptidase